MLRKAVLHNYDRGTSRTLPHVCDVGQHTTDSVNLTEIFFVTIRLQPVQKRRNRPMRELSISLTSLLIEELNVRYKI